MGSDCDHFRSKVFNLARRTQSCSTIIPFPSERPLLVAEENRREQTRRKNDLGKASPERCRNLRAGEANWGELQHNNSQVHSLNKNNQNGYSRPTSFPDQPAGKPKLFADWADLNRHLIVTKTLSLDTGRNLILNILNELILHLNSMEIKRCRCGHGLSNYCG